MNHLNEISLPKKPDKSLVSHISCRESHADDSVLSSHHMNRACDNCNTKEASHLETYHFLRLVKKLATVFSGLEYLNSKTATKSCSNTSPTEQPSMESFSLHKISNENISQVREPTKPKVSHRRHPSKHIFECQSPVVKPIKNVRRNLNAHKSHINSHASKTLLASTVELTPLSILIQQSYRDIEMLRLVHAAQRSGVENKSISGRELNLRETTLKDEKSKEIDLSRVEANLKKFEGLYAQFLKSSQNEYNLDDEVHLVAMICKRSEVVTGFLQAPTQPTS